MPKIKRYYMLLEQLREQDACVKAFEQRLLHIESTIVEHQNNSEHPISTKSIYDPLRNTASRSRRLAEVKATSQKKPYMLVDKRVDLCFL